MSKQVAVWPLQIPSGRSQATYPKKLRAKREMGVPLQHSELKGDVSTNLFIYNLIFHFAHEMFWHACERCGREHANPVT